MARDLLSNGPMLGNGGGGISNRTMIGVRGLSTDAPHTGRIQKRKGAEGDKRLDRVVREEERDGLFDYVEPEEEDEGREVALPEGHGAGVRAFPDEAFRRDAKGRPLPPLYSDVDQGNLSDAWLLAVAAAVAHVQPGELQRRILRHDEGRWRVRLGEDAIVVTPEFPSEGYADPTPNGQRDSLWVALLEKAYALREAGSYANLETGNPARALEALTGKRARFVAIGDHTALDRLFEIFRENRRAGAPMVLHTRDASVTTPLQPDHVYAVLEVLDAAGPAGSAISPVARKIRVYNPWGTNGNQKALDTLVHEVAVEDVRASADALFVGGRRA